MDTGTTGRPRILLVDDNLHILHILKLSLASHGFDPLTASGGSEAIEMAMQEVPDLILLDIMMPDVDGYQVCRALKADARTRDIPIIFVSARTEVPDRVLGLDMGAVDYVTKPFDVQEVASRARAAIRTRTRHAEMAHDLNRMRGEFLRLLAHEIATPLTAIQGFSELLETGLSHMSPEAQLDCFRVINQSSRRLTGTLDDFLCLVQAESLISVGLVPLARVVREQLDELALDFHDRRQVVEMDAGHAEGFLVPSHPRFLPRAIYHLLSNAVKFSPEGSTLKVRVYAEGELACLEVEDAGPGVPAHLMDKVFDRFFQVDASRTRVYAGMGIGLTVSRTLARSLGGDVVVKSSCPQGSVFLLTLPLTLETGRPLFWPQHP